MINDYRGVPRPWDYSFGSSFVLLHIQVLGEISSSQVEEPPKNTMVGAPPS